MMKIFRNLSLKEGCSIFKKNIIDVAFDNCLFDHLILSDVNFENVHFINCRFDHVFLESFYAKNILIVKSKISSLSLRGSRKITGKKLYSSVKHKRIEEVVFEDVNIIELVLGGDLGVINCKFPQGGNYLHFKDPFLVYSKCLQHVDKYWEGDKRRIGLIELQDYLSKGVKNQNEDFITFSDNEYLEADTNEVLRSVFLLIKEVSASIGSDSST